MSNKINNKKLKTRSCSSSAPSPVLQLPICLSPRNWESNRTVLVQLFSKLGIVLVIAGT